MNHSFDCDVAKQFGMLEAVIIWNFQHWIKLNRDNKRNSHEGRTWSYNSVQALHKQYFYVSADRIRRALDKLVEVGIFLKGNHGDRPADRTTWYAFADENLWVPESNHLAPLPNGIGTTAKAFGTTAKSTNKTDTYSDTYADKSLSAVAPRKYSALHALIELGVDQQFAADWLAVRSARKQPATKSAIDSVLESLAAAGFTPADGIKLCAQRAWAKFDPSWLANTSQQQPQRQQSAWAQKQEREQAFIERIQGKPNANRIIDIN